MALYCFINGVSIAPAPAMLLILCCLVSMQHS
jgi:hypothetical protein